MILSKKDFFIIIVLVLYQSKTIFGYTQTEKQNQCALSIKNHYEKVETGSDFIPSPKNYCKHGFYFFRYTDDPERNTFTNKDGTYNNDAEQYYFHLLTIVTFSPKAKTPFNYCSTRYRRYRARYICKQQLRSTIPDINHQPEEVFRWIYYNITLDDMNEDYNYLYDYLKHIIVQMDIEGPDETPSRFCQFRFPS